MVRLPKVPSASHPRTGMRIPMAARQRFIQPRQQRWKLEDCWVRWVVLGSILLLAAGVRLYGLDHQSFWTDEVLSIQSAGRIQSGRLLDGIFDPHGPLYFYLLALVLPTAPDETSARLLSVVLGVLLVVAIWALAKELMSDRAAILAALMAGPSAQRGLQRQRIA